MSHWPEMYMNLKNDKTRDKSSLLYVCCIVQEVLYDNRNTAEQLYLLHLLH